MTWFKVYESIQEVPSGWDTVKGKNYHLSREYLLHAEKTQPCQQRYAVFYNDIDEINGILLWHRQKLDLFTLAHFPFKLEININCIAPPASVHEPAIIVQESIMKDVEKFLASLSGLTLILNLPSEFPGLRGWLRMSSLPVCCLPLRWKNFNEYLASQRSNYRHRCRKALAKGAALFPRKLENNTTDFTTNIYSLYEQVHFRAKHKLEKLSFDYFRYRKGDIIVFEDTQGTPHGFIQIYQDKTDYIFAFTGLNYETIKRYDTYLRMLLWIIDDALKSGCSTLVMGQTTEQTKCRLGAMPVPTYLLVKHRNPIIHFFLRIMSRFLVPPRPVERFNVFVKNRVLSCA